MRPLRFLGRLLALPWRLPRRRISAQLIYSYLLVVVLTIFVLEIAVGLVIVAAGVGSGVYSSSAPSAALGDEARAAATLVNRDGDVRALTASSAGASPADIVALDERVRAIAEHGPMTDAGDQGTGAPTAFDKASLALPDVAKVAVTDLSGAVVASSDTTWLPLGRLADAQSDTPAESVTRRAVELRGAPTAFGNLAVLDASNFVSAAAYPIVAPDGEVVGVVTVQSERRNPFATLAGLGPRELALGVVFGNALVFGVVAVPALLVATPVGIWRARAISRRLSALAGAADAMAAGDLSRRVEVRGEDEIARLAMHLNGTIARLDQADRARKAFIANVSHELRTPLAIIQGHVEQLQARHAAATAAVAAADDASSLETMRRETATLGRLIDDLFTLARLEEAVLPLEMGPVALREIAAQAVDGVRVLAWEQRKVTVQSIAPDDLPPALGDRARVRQIIANLLHNALRHTPEGGLIVVDARADGERVHVSVSDTGPGIAAEELPRVFDRFFRVERAGRADDGAGLGLAIVKQLVEAQGGGIHVESAPGGGATFRFTLPRA